jgi:hypothetical protein
MNKLELLEKREDRKWVNLIPALSFPSNWKIVIIPPFGDAVIRFIVECDDVSVSVYMDGFSKLGYYFDIDGNEIPYWEIYPYGENVGRTELQDADGLLEMIKESIHEQVLKRSDTE